MQHGRRIAVVLRYRVSEGARLGRKSPENTQKEVEEQKGLDKSVYQQKSLAGRVQHARPRASHRRCSDLQKSFRQWIKLLPVSFVWRKYLWSLHMKVQHSQKIKPILGKRSTHVCTIYLCFLLFGWLVVCPFISQFHLHVKIKGAKIPAASQA